MYKWERREQKRENHRKMRVSGASVKEIADIKREKAQEAIKSQRRYKENEKRPEDEDEDDE